MEVANPWCGEDVVPRFQWVIRISRVATKIVEDDNYDRYPAGYGFAYRDQMRRVTVIMPVPLNLIVGWGRKAWFNLFWGVEPHPQESIRARIFEEGRQYGRAQKGREQRMALFSDPL